MSPTGRLWTLLLAALAVAGAALAGAGLWLLGAVDDPALRERLLAAGGLVAAGEVAALALLGLTAHRGLLRPQAALARFAQAAADAAPRPGLPHGPLLGSLPAALGVVADALDEARAALRHHRTDDADAQRARLEAVLRQLDQGVIVCDEQSRILMYNPAARRVLRHSVGLGLGRPLGDIWARAPLEDALATLERRRGQPVDPGALPATEFLTTSLDDGALLYCRLCVLPEAGTDGNGVVLTFEDVTRRIEDLARHDRRLRQAVDSLRAPLTSVMAAAESLATAEQPAERQAFEAVLLEEGRSLAERFRKLATESQRFVPTPWTMADVHPEDLVANLARRRDPALPDVVLMGQPQWLHADGHALGQLLEHLIRQLAAHTGSREFAVETVNGGSGVQLDLVWRGEPVPVAELEAWIAEPLPEAIGQLTGREVLERHGSEIWSEPHRRRWGHAVIRIPLPAGRSVRRAGAARRRSRPEFFHASGTPAQATAVPLDTPLQALGFTVFDTETTGLHPEAGDEVIAIAGVRIVRAQRLPDEQFQRLVYPRRPIPRESIRWHGITDAEVAEAPPIEEVLPEFRRFVGDDVLVAHNADFDMCFLRLKEPLAQVHFDNPVLDTLLLSLHLDGDLEDHTLEAIAGRLGVTVNGRHTALGDAVATAEVFTRLLERAREAGIVTLGQALEASQRTLEARLGSAGQ